jgi:uncharacterized protein YebE (UPF0316 family)
MDQSILLTGILIFVARVLDVSFGTMRTIATVQGRMVVAFVLGIFEIVLWVTVVGAVINSLSDNPILLAFYALGFATGNVVGIMVEKKIALGPVILKLIVEERNKEQMIDMFENLFLDVTTFSGMGRKGPVAELYTVCRRKDLKYIFPRLREVDPNAFFVTEQARDVSAMPKPINGSLPGSKPSMNGTLKPITAPLTGWRAVLKKK